MVQQNSVWQILVELDWYLHNFLDYRALVRIILTVSNLQEIDPRDDGGRIEVIGTQEERELARLCVDITLQQRNNGKVHVDIERLESRKDMSSLDVHKEAVGFVLVKSCTDTFEYVSH
jgi:hypothetical protein